MPVTFTGPTGGTWSLGAVIALVVLVVAIVLLVINGWVPVIAMIAALALARLC